MKTAFFSMTRHLKIVFSIAAAWTFFGMSPMVMAGTNLILSEESTFQDVLFTTEKVQAGLGTSMVKGDFNGDGVDDFAIGAIQEGAPRTTEEVGMVTVFFGGSSIGALPDQVKIGKVSDNLESARLYDATIPNNWLGVLMTVGDFNGDKRDDLAIAAQNESDDDRSSKIYIIFGNHIQGDVALNQSADVILERDAMHIGAIAAGDFNGEEEGEIPADDLVISDILTSSVKHLPVMSGHTPSGGVYVVLGRSEWPKAIDLGTLNGEMDDDGEPITNGVDLLLQRNGGEDVFQVAGIAVGDLDNDSIDDLALGAPEESNALYSLENAGRVYVIFGGGTFPNGKAEIPLDLNSHTTHPVDIVIYGGEENDKIGGSLEVTDYNDQPLAIGDITGDGKNDLIIGAPLSMLGNVNSTGMGKVEVLFGRDSWNPTYDLYDGYDVRLVLSEEARRIGVETGYRVAVEDINGDDIGDMLIASHHGMLVGNEKPAGVYFNGVLHVIYGGATIQNQKEYGQLDRQSDLQITTEDMPDQFSQSHLGQTFVVGNFDDEGTPDILVAAPKGEGVSGETSAGWAVMLKDVSPNCITGDVENGYAISIPSVRIEGISTPVGMTLIPDATFAIWTLSDYWLSEEGSNTISLGSDLILSLACVDFGALKVSFSVTLDALQLQNNIFQFIIDPSSFIQL